MNQELARELKNSIAGRILKYDCVTFAEMIRLKGFEGGDHTLQFSSPDQGFDNIILWAGMSAEGAWAVEQIRKDERFAMEEASPMSYMVDGAVPNFPLAKEKRIYDEPHWLPVCFSVKRPQPKRSARH